MSCNPRSALPSAATRPDTGPTAGRRCARSSIPEARRPSGRFGQQQRPGRRQQRSRLAATAAGHAERGVVGAASIRPRLTFSQPAGEGVSGGQASHASSRGAHVQPLQPQHRPEPEKARTLSARVVCGVVVGVLGLPLCFPLLRLWWSSQFPVLRTFFLASSSAPRLAGPSRPAPVAPPCASVRRQPCRTSRKALVQLLSPRSRQPPTTTRCSPLATLLSAFLRSLSICPTACSAPIARWVCRQRSCSCISSTRPTAPARSGVCLFSPGAWPSWLGCAACARREWDRCAARVPRDTLRMAPHHQLPRSPRLR